MRFTTTITAAAALVCVTGALAQRSQRVSIEGRGTTSVSGAVRGRQYADYRVPVGAGQAIKVTLRSASKSVYFNVNPPRSDVSLYVGSIAGSRMPWRVIPSAGEYVVRVYQMGAAQTSGRVNAFRLAIGVRGTALRPLRSRVDARLPGTPYHARGPVRCSLELTRNRSTCDAYVIRYGGGSATVEFRAGPIVRRVLFVRGKPKASDSAESFTYAREGDDTTVRFGDGPSEEYTVPDALVYGG